MRATLTGLSAAAGLGFRRAFSAPVRWLPAAFAVALAVGLLGGLTAAGVVAGDHAARRTVAAIPAGRETVLLTWNGGAGPRVDRTARAGLRAMGAGSVTRGLLLAPTRLSRGLVRFAAIGPIARWVRVTSGRLPRGACRPERCEAIAIDGAPPPRTVAGRGVRLVVVGAGALPSRVPLGFATRGPDPRADPARRPYLLVSGDPDGVDALRGVESVSRGQTWSAAPALRGLHVWDLGGAIGRILDGQRTVDRGGRGFTTATPTGALRQAVARAQATPGRLRAAGAAAVAVLLAFLMLAAGALRGGLLAEDARSRRGGATAGQRSALALAETAVPVVAGLVAGCALAVGVALIRASAGSVDAGHVLDETARGAAGRLPVVAAVAWLAVLLAARAPGRLGAPLAGAGLIAAAATLAGILVPRGGHGASDPLPDVVVPLAGAAMGLLVALVAPSVLRLLARPAPRRRPHVRIALLELARDPAPAAIAAAGLAVAVGLGGFAFSYRATLDRSRHDQAVQQVPLAATVAPGPSLAAPLRAREPAAWRAVPGVEAVAPVIRREASAIVGPTRDPVTLLGVPSDGTVEPRPPGVNGAASPRGAASSASGLATSGTESPGARLPVAATTVSLRVAASDRLAATLVVRRPGGGVLDQIPLRGAASAAGRALTATIPRSARGGTVTAVLLKPPSGLVATAGHQGAEGGPGSEVASGSAELSDLRAGGVPLDALGGWSGHRAARGGAHAIRYGFGSDLTAIVRPPTPTDRTPLPVRADPETLADTGGRPFTLSVLGVEIPARAVGPVGRVPNVRSGTPVVLADVAALRDALDANTPGSGEPRELWLQGDPTAAAGAARGLHLRVRTQASVRRTLESEPVSREVLGALAAAGLLAAALAVGGVGVAVRRALGDGAHALLDLEAQGVGPAALRRGLRLRGLTIALLGTIPGLALAAGLAALVTRAVRAGALGAAPDPPLTAVLPVGAGLAAAALLLVAATAVAALVTAPAFREPVPHAGPSAEGA